MARKPRDYKAEYERRQQLARSRGFDSYSQQRRKIERGEVPAIDRRRIRKESTREAQDRLGDLQIWRGRPIRAYRVDMAQNWSDRKSRSDLTKFDPERGWDDPDYLSAYLQGPANEFNADNANFHHYHDTEELHHYLVDMGFMTEEEYQQRYGEKE